MKYTGQSAKFGGSIRKPKKMRQKSCKMNRICNHVTYAGECDNPPEKTILVKFSAAIPVSCVNNQSLLTGSASNNGVIY